MKPHRTLLDKELIFKDPNYSKKILLFDVENSPLVSYTWGIWEQDVIEVKEEWYILCFAYKWLGEKETHVVAMPDFKGYSKDKKNDYKVVKKLHELFNQAEVLIAHNGDQFDIKKANARFIQHGLEPPKPYKTIDTLKLARKHFKFDSNKLDYLGQYLRCGRKLPHTGKHLWFGCMEGDPASWKLMKQYNVQDVILLEKIYIKLRGWATNGVNMNLILGGFDKCPRCGSEHINKQGYDYKATTIRQSYRCMNCGARPSGELVKMIDKPLK